MTRYGLAGLLVGHPLVRRYRPAPPDTPEERELRRRAARDRDAGIEPKDWPEADREAWKDDPKGHLRRMRSYEIARHPERLEAPVPWLEQIPLLALNTALWATGDNTFSWRGLRQTAVLWPVISLSTRWQTSARQRAAQRLGVTPRTAPRPIIGGDLLLLVLALPPLELWRRARGRPPHEKLPWATWLAVEIVKAVDERRSYASALRRTSTGVPPDSSEATAASQTAAAA